MEKKNDQDHDKNRAEAAHLESLVEEDNQGRYDEDSGDCTDGTYN